MSTTTTSLSSDRTTGDQSKVIAATLTAARAKIAKPNNWCQHSFARDSNGGEVVECDEMASAFCARGALIRVTGEWVCIGHPAYDALREQMGEPLVRYNDTHTHAEVLAAFDRAIAATESARVTALSPVTTTEGA